MVQYKQKGKGGIFMKRIQGFLCGFLAAIVLLISVPALAETIQATFNVINIKINGKLEVKAGEYFTLPDGREVPYTIVYSDTTYLPLRETVRLVGKELLFDGATSTADIIDNRKTEDKDMEDIINDIIKEIQGDPGEVPFNKYGLPDFSDYKGTRPEMFMRDGRFVFEYDGVEYVDIAGPNSGVENPLLPERYRFNQTFIDGRLSGIMTLEVIDLETKEITVLIEEVPYAKLSPAYYFVSYDYYLNTILPLIER